MSLWNLFCRAVGLTGLFPQSRLFNAEAYGGWKRDTEREVDIVTGCFFLIEHRFWDTLGGFDPLFFMYGEEADLCLRARPLGARPRITPDARIVHYGGASERVRAEQIIRVSLRQSLPPGPPHAGRSPRGRGFSFTGSGHYRACWPTASRCGSDQ